MIFPPFFLAWIALELRCALHFLPSKPHREVGDVARELANALVADPATGGLGVAVVLSPRDLFAWWHYVVGASGHAKALGYRSPRPTHVIDLSGVYLPRQGTPVALVIARPDGPELGTAPIRATLCSRGEPVVPADPAAGL